MRFSGEALRQSTRLRLDALQPPRNSKATGFVAHGRPSAPSWGSARHFGRPARPSASASITSSARSHMRKARMNDLPDIQAVALLDLPDLKCLGAVQT